MKKKDAATLEAERIMCWLNKWGDIDQHEAKSREWREGYEQALMDALPRVKAHAPDWLDTWRKEFIQRKQAA